MSNRTKVWVITLSASFITLLLFFQVLGREGLLLGLLILLSGIFGLFHYQDGPLYEQFKIKPLKGQDPWGITTRFQQICHNQDFEDPELVLIDSPQPIALSTTKLNGQAIVALSSGLIEKLSATETEAILLHQILASQRWQKTAMTVLKLPMCSLWGIAHYFETKFSLVFKGKLYQIVDAITSFWFLFGFFKRSYLAIDTHSHQYLHDRRALGLALWKLNSYSESKPIKAAKLLEIAFIVNPQGEISKPNIFSPQPKLEVRIKKLLGYFPI